MVGPMQGAARGNRQKHEPLCVQFWMEFSLNPTSSRRGKCFKEGPTPSVSSIGEDCGVFVVVSPRRVWCKFAEFTSIIE